jgi:hypothetical protein
MGLMLLCCSLLPVPDSHSVAPAFCSVEGVSRAVWMAKGRVLAFFVLPGMTRDQVRRILGEPSFWAVEGGMEMDAFGPYAVQVFWTNPLAGPHRGKTPTVDEVRYVWECWTCWGQR